ncbi:MAG: HIT family protein [Patescibacteria group bacterium]|nr:HIT family protein [Patescibacteria group bacterium]
MNENNVVLFETEHWKVVLLDDQLYLGRCVVALKRPCQNLADLNEKENEDWLEVVKKLESSFRKAFGAFMFNWSCLMNSDPEKRQVHWHFRPRYDKPVQVDGRVFEDPNFGQHALSGPNAERSASREELAAIIERLNDLHNGGTSTR